MAMATSGTPGGSASVLGRNSNGRPRWINAPEMSEARYTIGGRTRFATSRAALEMPLFAVCCHGLDSPVRGYGQPLASESTS